MPWDWSMPWETDVQFSLRDPLSIVLQNSNIRIYCNNSIPLFDVTIRGSVIRVEKMWLHSRKESRWD